MNRIKLHWWLIIIALLFSSIAFVLGMMEYYLSAALIMLFSPSLSMAAVAYQRSYYAIVRERSGADDQTGEA
ncbi:hypothetical protein P4H35_27385 [Paenibacillus taichungensis]|nr:hypothetical protein [Paenibacillus taichungensis]MEC0200095.1 hypothetical protein [Paenibacillus taichungensis]